MLEQETLTIEGKGSCIITCYNNGKANIMVIDSVEIKKEYRKQGYGTQLMERAVSLAKEKNIDCIELVVNDDSIARKLYIKIGFQETNKIHCRMILNEKNNNTSKI
jgi:ribosomal protein S18 acetylase RimI-like enzyme